MDLNEFFNTWQFMAKMILRNIENTIIINMLELLTENIVTVY